MSGKDKAAKALQKTFGLRYTYALKWHTSRRSEIKQYAEDQGIGYRAAAIEIFRAETAHRDEQAR